MNLTSLPVLLFVCMLCTKTNAQTKKEQIELLNKNIDSLKLELRLQDDENRKVLSSKNIEIADFQKQVLDLNFQLDKTTKEIVLLNGELNLANSKNFNLQLNINALNDSIMSLNSVKKAISQEKLPNEESTTLVPSDTYGDFIFESINGDYRLKQNNTVILDTSYFDPEWNNEILLSCNDINLWNKVDRDYQVGKKKTLLGINDSPYGYRRLFVLNDDGHISQIAENEYLNVVSATWIDQNNLILISGLEDWCDLSIYNSAQNTIRSLNINDLDSNKQDCYSVLPSSIIPLSREKIAIVLEYSFNDYLDCPEKEKITRKQIDVPLPFVKIFNL